MTRPNLFKANIAKKLAAKLGPKVLAATLTRKAAGTRGAGALTAGQVVGASEVSYTCRGFTDEFDASKIQNGKGGGPAVYGSLIAANLRTITILGGSLPDDIDPKPGDVITIEGADWYVLDVFRDPAGATFECVGRL